MNFRLLGIPVSLHPSFWLFLGYVVFLSGDLSPATLAFLGCLTFSLLFHEFGHALTALYFGQNPSIHLVAFGGYAAYNGIGLTRKSQTWITLNGPLATLVLASFSFFCLKTGLVPKGMPQLVLATLFRINLLLLGLNLVPLLPLDGGKLMKLLLESKLGGQKGMKATLLIGNITAIGGILYACFGENYLLSSLFLYHGLNNWQLYNQLDWGKEESISPHGLYQEGIRAMQTEDLDKAKAVFKKLLKHQDKQLQVAAVEGLAAALEKQGSTKEAYHLLLKADPAYLKQGKWLLCKLAYAEGNYSLVDLHGRDIYALRPTYETALLISKAYARLNRGEEAGGWMHTASQFDDVPKELLRELIQDSLYDSVRQDPGFQQYAEKIHSLRKESTRQ